MPICVARIGSSGRISISQGCLAKHTQIKLSIRSSRPNLFKTRPIYPLSRFYLFTAHNGVFIPIFWAK